MKRQAVAAGKEGAAGKAGEIPEGSCRVKEVTRQEGAAGGE